MEVALSCGDQGLPFDIRRIILLEGMREKIYEVRNGRGV